MPRNEYGVARPTAPQTRKQIHNLLRQEFDEAIRRPPHTRTHFHAGDGEACNLVIAWEFLGVEPTNPPDADKERMFRLAKMIELAHIGALNEAGMVKDIQKRIQFPIPQHVLDASGIELKREWLVSGKPDLITTRDVVNEIKSIKDTHWFKLMSEGCNKANLIQNGVYLEPQYPGNRGKLTYIRRGDGKLVDFEVKRWGSRVVAFRKDNKHRAKNKDPYYSIVQNADLDETFAKYARIALAIENGVLPEKEYEYKYSAEKLGKMQLSKTAMEKAERVCKRDGSSSGAVIGDWQCKLSYCKFRDLCMEIHGIEEGYTQEEAIGVLEVIKEQRSKGEKKDGKSIETCGGSENQCGAEGDQD